MSIQERLDFLGIQLPPTPQALAAYIPSQRVGQVIYTSGQLPLKNGKIEKVGLLGREVTKDEGIRLAEICLLNALSSLLLHISSLDEISKIVKLGVFVASVPEFQEHHLVANGASDLLLRIFDERGQHARFAIGAASLPLGAPVEIELCVEVI